MMRRRDMAGLAVLGLAGGAFPPRLAMAQTRAESLRVLSEAGPNGFDPIGPGVNRGAIQAHWNLYDRLLRFGTRAGADGTLTYDYDTLEGELAEGFERSADQTVTTLHLRRDATFHDGAPVTAADAKWSLDRVVSLPAGRSQFATGSMTSPEQFVVLDAHTLRITTPRPDRFTLPNLAATQPIMINAALARAHATAEDPWASEWLRGHAAGGGPFRLEAHVPGQSVTFSRFDEWRNGPLPAFRRVLWQVVPNAQLRRLMLERGDADLVQDLAPQDAVSLAQAGQVKVVGVPMAGTFHCIGMNTALPPFDNIKLRQAIAAVLPYRQMFEAALFQRGQPLFGGRPDEADGLRFPQPMGQDTDLPRARRLLAEAGMARGFETSFSFDVSLATVAEPVALLLQEALGQLGIRVSLNKVAGSQFGSLLEKKQLPFFFEASTAFFAAPDYFFRIFYHGPTRWNFGSYANPEFQALVERTRFGTDEAAYAADVARMIALAKQEVPVILLWQPALELGMQRDIEGYTYQFHRMLDLRHLRRG